MVSRLGLICGVALAAAGVQAAQARDFEMGGDNQYPYSIMAPEPGTGPHHRAAARKRHGRTTKAPTAVAAPATLETPATAPSQPSTPKPSLAVRGSSGSVLPTPLPKTRLIPPEGSGTLTIPALPQEQGRTVVPGMTTTVPNLPHGPETFQDRASRCAHQAGVYGVPGNLTTQYMGACSM
jgi:hypothetical protein